MDKSNSQAGSRLKRLAAAVAFGLIAGSPLIAFASSGVDLSVGVSVSPNGTGKAKITYTIKNNGTVAANGWNVMTYLEAPGFSSVGINANSFGVGCGFVTSPSGYNATYNCSTTQSLAAGATATLTGTINGTNESALTVYAHVTPDESVVDDVATNNAVTAATIFGPAEDLAVFSVAKPGVSPHHASVAVTVVNESGGTAKNVSYIAQIASPHVSSILSVSSSGVAQSCAIVSPSAGYNLAYQCTLSADMAGKTSSTVLFDVTGDASASGAAFRQDVRVASSSQGDPKSINNVSTSNTTYK